MYAAMYMPTLLKDAPHGCFLCKKQISNRGNLKAHLTKSNKNGKTRCPGLKKVLSTNEWDEKILPYFRDGAELLELPSYKVKSPIGKRKRKSIGQLTHTNQLQRLKRDHLMSRDGKCKYTEDELLTMLSKVCDKDGRWVLRQWRNVGPKKIRQDLSDPVPPVPGTLTATKALQLNLFSGLTSRGYKLLRSTLPLSFPTRNELGSLGKELLPIWIRADSHGAYTVPMEVIRQTAKDFLELFGIRFWLR